MSPNYMSFLIDFYYILGSQMLAVAAFASGETRERESTRNNKSPLFTENKGLWID